MWLGSSKYDKRCSSGSSCKLKEKNGAARHGVGRKQADQADSSRWTVPIRQCAMPVSVWSDARAEDQAVGVIWMRWQRGSVGQRGPLDEARGSRRAAHRRPSSFIGGSVVGDTVMNRYLPDLP